MKFKDLLRSENIEQDKKLNKKFSEFEILLLELEKREIPQEIIKLINQRIDDINLFEGSNKDLLKIIKKILVEIFKLLEKELNLVPKNLYRARWMAIGMAVFGVPLGVSFSASLDNMAFIGIGLPLGMVIGMAIGASMDKKALEEGRQLDIEYNY